MLYLFITTVSLYAHRSDTSLIQASCRYQSIQKCKELCLIDVRGLKLEMWGKQTEKQNLNNSEQLDSVFTSKLYTEAKVSFKCGESQIH